MRIALHIIASIALYSLIFSGCTGIVTGHTYTAQDVINAKEAYIKIRDAYGVIEAEKKRIDSDGFATTPIKEASSFSIVGGD